MIALGRCKIPILPIATRTGLFINTASKATVYVYNAMDDGSASVSTAGVVTAGATLLTNMFRDTAGVTLLSNPVILDSFGGPDDLARFGSNDEVSLSFYCPNGVYYALVVMPDGKRFGIPFIQSAPTPPSLLITLLPTGNEDVRDWAGSTGTLTRGDTGAATSFTRAGAVWGTNIWSSATLRDVDNNTYCWGKSVNTGGFGTQTILRTNFFLDTCPNYFRIEYLKVRTLVKMIKNGNASKTYLGIEGSDQVSPIHTDLLTIVPVNNADWAWQEYLVPYNFDVDGITRIPFTSAGVNARNWGTDWDQYLTSGNPAADIEYRISRFEVQVWGWV